MLKIQDFAADGLLHPAGIASGSPDFSWRLVSDRSRVLQTGFELQIAPDDSFSDPVFDSGVVPGESCRNVRFPGLKLEGARRYAARVRARDNHGERSEWSETLRFVTPLAADAWQARFVTGKAAADPTCDAGQLLRRVFLVPGDKELRAAFLFASAKGLYEASVNGKKAGDALLTPGWTEYGKRLQFQTYDVTGCIRPGENVLGAMLGSGWYKGRIGFQKLRNAFGEEAAFVCELHLLFADGSEQVVATDSAWKSGRSPIVFSGIYDGETYDARLEQPGWDAPGFDDTQWEPAMVLNDSLSVLVPQDGEFVREHEVFSPCRVLSSPDGETVLDFGQNMSGFVRFTVQGRAGSSVRLRHAEELHPDGRLYVENLRTAKQEIVYVLSGNGRETFRPHFTFQGFRYVGVTVEDGPVIPEDFSAVAVYSDMRPTGSFFCSNPLLNRLQSNIEWGMKSNFLDVPTDCPQRDERLGWTGDAQIFARTACFLMDTHQFFRKWLRDMAAAQLEGGGIPYVVPDVTSWEKENNHSSAAWGDVAAICPWTMYLSFGDRELLREQYPMMKGWVGFIRSRAQDGVLWNSGFHFGDWVALDAKEGSYVGATPIDLIATAYYAYSTRLVVKAAKVLGYEEDAREYEVLYGRIVQAFRDEFYTPNGRLAARTQTAYILALWFELAPPAFVERTADDLVALLKESGHMLTGFVGTPYLCPALAKAGRWEEAFALLTQTEYPSWLYPVTKGATTIWEHLDGIKPDGSMWSADMNSFNHYAYGAIGEWMYRDVAGLDFDEDCPGGKRWRIAPHVGGGLTNASASLQSGYGEASVSWRLVPDGEGTRMEMTVVIPPNTTASAVLPGENVVCDPPCEAVDGTFELGSGRYVFTSRPAGK